MTALRAAQLEQFAEEGYLVVEDVLDPAYDLQPVLREYEGVLDRIAAELHAAGAIASPLADLPFDARLIAIMRETGREFGQHFDMNLPGVCTPDTPFHVGPAIFRLLTQPRLLDVAQSVVGPEIFASPVQHVRMKPPAALVPPTARSIVSKTPWHQDSGVVLPEADDSEILTVWIPATAATVENGCLVVESRSQRRGLVDHCPRFENGRKGLSIPDSLIEHERVIPLPMRPGSILLLTRTTMHASLDNTTADQVRISFDLRYQPVGTPTGRPDFDQVGFIARSAAHPERVLRDANLWQQRWLHLRETLAAQSGAPAAFMTRWRTDAPACA